MPEAHSLPAMIDRIRALLTVIEEGSVNRAAVRLRITQPALSRQMQSLETEIGGKLLERQTSGVKPTGLGHAMVKSMRPLADAYDAALAELRRQARGDRSELRVGYLISAAQSVLTPSLARLRKTHPEVKHQMPGRNQWMSALSKTAGFKPRFVIVVDGITNVLSLVASENAVTLLPAYFQEFNHPGVVFVPISDAGAKWDFIVLWQRGKVPASTRALVQALKESAARFA